MACKQCELSRVKGVVITKCGTRSDKIVECDCVDTNGIEEISQTELLSELNDIDNEEAE